MRRMRIAPWLSALALVAAACGGGTSSPSASAIHEIGEGEGALNLVIWAGYAERGETDRREFEGPIVEDDPDDPGHLGARTADVGDAGSDGDRHAVSARRRPPWVGSMS